MDARCRWSVVGAQDDRHHLDDHCRSRIWDVGFLGDRSVQWTGFSAVVDLEVRTPRVCSRVAVSQVDVSLRSWRRLAGAWMAAHLQHGEIESNKYNSTGTSFESHSFRVKCSVYSVKLPCINPGAFTYKPTQNAAAIGWFATWNAPGVN